MNQSGEESLVAGALSDVAAARYPVLFDMADPMLGSDTQGRLVDANPAVLALLGYTRDELLRLHLDEISTVTPPGSPAWPVGLHPEDVPHEVSELRRRDGSRLPVQLRDVLAELPEGGRRFTVFRDLTLRLQQTKALRESTARQEFLLGLSDRLRTISDPRSMMTIAAEALGRQLGVSAAGYCEVSGDGNASVSGGEYGDGRIPRLVGSGYTFRLSDYGPAWGPSLGIGEELFIEDIARDERAPQGGTVESRATGLRASAAVPLMKGGRLVATLYAAHPEPRPWPNSDRELMRAVAHRTWEAAERARAEAALRESEVRYRALAHTSAHSIWRMTGDGARLIEIQGGLLSPHDLTLDATGDWLPLHAHPEDQDAILAAWQNTVATRTIFDHVHRLRAADGEYRWIHAHAAPVVDEQGAVREWSGMSTDITERVEAEAALRQSEERYRTLVHATTSAVWRASGDGQQFLELQGGPLTPYDQERGPTSEWLELYTHPDDRNATLQAWQRAVATNSDYDIVNRLRTAVGDYRWFRSHAIPVLDEQGSVQEWIGTATDITENKHLDQVRQDLLAMASHDLRTPLAVISLHAQLMQDRQAYDEAGLLAIREQARRMERLIEDLVDVVHLESGKLTLQPEEIDLAVLVHEAAARAQSQTDRHAVSVDAPATPVLGFWDRARIEQILDNLLGNAFKYSPQGGVVVVRLRVSGMEALVSVTDQGVGITAATLPRLFERFQRADEIGTTGLGLGLYVTRMLAEAHHGRVLVESVPGDGSTFTVHLPLGTGNEEGERSSLPRHEPLQEWWEIQ